MAVPSFRGASKVWRKEQRRMHEVQQREKLNPPPEEEQAVYLYRLIAKWPERTLTKEDL